MALYLNGVLVLAPHLLGGAAHTADTLANLNAKVSDADLVDEGHAHTGGADGAVIDHGTLDGLSDDDHSQYHNDARGDARYFQETEFLAASAGAGDSGKPIKLDADGNVDATMINDADVDHGALGGLGDDDHSQYSLADGSRAFSATVAGVTPAVDADLATKEYVDLASGGDARSLFPAVPGGTLGLAGAQVAYVAWHDAYATEAPGQIKLPACVVKKIRFYISSNTLNSDTAVTLRKNGVDTTDTLTIGSTATGWFEADWDTTFAADDLLSLEFDLGGNGAQGIFYKGGTYELLLATE